MLVSVVVPVYNVQDYLGKCVESIRTQTYRDLEIILVDDGSTDKCGSMCDEFAQIDSRIKVIHKKNGGLSDARNAGIEIAKGKYVFFLDSDDYINQHLVEKAVAVAEEFQCDIVYYDYKRLEPSGAVEECGCNLPEKTPISLKERPDLLLQTISACMKFFLREFYLKTGVTFPVGYRYEDLGTVPLFLYYAESVVYLKEPLYYYLIREGSITTGTDCERNYKHRKKMVDRVLAFYKENGAFQQYRKELEYLAFYNMYFLPVKEMLYSAGKTPYIKKCKDYIRTTFPEYKKNVYIKQMSRKERLQFGIIDKEQFWMMNVLSWARKQSDRLRKR